jgi:hypothetical protein
MPQIDRFFGWESDGGSLDEVYYWDTEMVLFLSKADPTFYIIANSKLQ